MNTMTHKFEEAYLRIIQEQNMQNIINEGILPDWWPTWEEYKSAAKDMYVKPAQEKLDKVKKFSEEQGKKIADDLENVIVKYGENNQQKVIDYINTILNFLPEKDQNVVHQTVETLKKSSDKIMEYAKKENLPTDNIIQKYHLIEKFLKSANNLITEEPLTVGAVVTAIGVTIKALLPLIIRVIAWLSTLVISLYYVDKQRSREHNQRLEREKKYQAVIENLQEKLQQLQKDQDPNDPTYPKKIQDVPGAEKLLAPYKDLLKHND